MNRIILLFILLIFTTPVFASDYTVHKLSNGQTVVIYEIKNNPLVTIDTWIKTGSINETDTNSGVSHFLEHLFFKGTKAHPTGDMDRILESKGAIVNAATSKDFTHYYITIPSEFFDTALELHADMLMHPQIPRKELEKERKVVLEEISKDMNTPSHKVFENLNNLMYTTHPYKRKVIGSEKVIETIRREEILDYFNAHYVPSNMITLIVGDVNTDKAIAKVQSAFNAPFTKLQRCCFKKEHALQTQKRNVEYLDSTQSGYLMIGFRSAPINDKDTFALDVLSEILGGSKSSKLYHNIKEQKGLAYTISTSNASFKDDGIFYINANFIPSNKDKIEKAIFDEISYIQKYGVTDEELLTAKKIITQKTYFSRESTSDITSELGYILTLTGSPTLYDNYVAGIQAVTASDIKAAAQKYLGVNKSAVSLILPKSMEFSQEQNRVSHTAEKISENNGTSKYIVDTGTTLLINENKNNDIVAISIIVKGGEFIENKIGEGTLTAATLMKGTSKYSAQELAKILEENGIEVTPSCKEDFFFINIKTTTAQIDKTMEILDEIVNNAIFDEYELEKKRSEILSKIKQSRDVPMNVAIENYKTSIFEGSVYSHTNKVIEKSLPQIQREDVLRYYNKVLDAKNVIVSINGNVNAEKMIADIGAIFKNKNNPKIDYNKYTVTKLKAPKTVSESINNLQTGWLFLGWQTSGINNKKDFIALKVINTILGSGLSSRLYKNLREEYGLAYQLGSSYTPKMLGGSFVTYIGTNPQNLKESESKILREVNRLKMEFVSDSELQDAKDRLKGGFVIAMETNSEKASNIGLFEAYGFGYDFLSTYIKMIDEVTASDIVSVANKYFNNNVVKSEVK